MKKLLFSALTLVSISTMAQPITVEKGKVYKMKSEIKSDMNMGMGVQTSSKLEFENKVTFMGEENGKLVFLSEVGKLKSKAEMMGNTMEYDSENPGAADAQVKEMMEGLQKTKTKMLVDKNTGETTVLDADKNLPIDRDVTNGMDMLSMNNMNTQSGLFMIIPNGTKPGATWKDSSDVEGSKIVNAYTLDKIENGSSVINHISTVSVKGDKEIQGMPVKMDMVTISNGKITVDNKTYLVVKREADANITGNMEVQGMPMPLTGTTKVEIKID